jgi:hypothetical protein
MRRPAELEGSVVHRSTQELVMLQGGGYQPGQFA